MCYLVTILRTRTKLHFMIYLIHRVHCKHKVLLFGHKKYSFQDNRKNDLWKNSGLEEEIALIVFPNSVLIIPHVPAIE